MCEANQENSSIILPSLLTMIHDYIILDVWASQENSCIVTKPVDYDTSYERCGLVRKIHI